MPGRCALYGAILSLWIFANFGRTKDNELSNDEKNFLRLIARNIWIARREGTIVGCLHSLGVGLLDYLAVFELGPSNPISAICYVGMLAIVYDAYQRVLKVP